MGQEYWMKYKTDRKKVETYLIAQGLPKDGKDLIIKSEKGGVDCWLSWHGTRLDIASQIFDDQSAWCAAIARRLHELFPCDKFGADSSGWWEEGSKPHRPFYFSMKCFKQIMRRHAQYAATVKAYEKSQRLFIKEAKRLLP